MGMGMGTEARDEQASLNKREVYATRRLLELLKEHHGYNIKKPIEAPKLKIVEKTPGIPKDIKLEELPSRQGKIREFTPGATWFAVEDIKKTVCAYFDLTHEELISSAKPARLVYPRQIGMYLACRYGRHSYAETGRRFGFRDHATILHAYKKIKRLISSDWTLAFDVAQLEALLGAA